MQTLTLTISRGVELELLTQIFIVSSRRLRGKRLPRNQGRIQDFGRGKLQDFLTHPLFLLALPCGIDLQGGLNAVLGNCLIITATLC